MTSAAFSRFEMSVDSASIQQNMSITRGDDTGVAEFEAAATQALNQRTVADPLPETPHTPSSLDPTGGVSGGRGLGSAAEGGEEGKVDWGHSNGETRQEPRRSGE